MSFSPSSNFSAIRKIDNTRRKLPIVSTLIIAILIVILVWFFRGGSFRLYASLFFGLYFLTKSSWLSIILVSVVQNIALLPLNILYEKYHSRIKDFESEIEETKTDEQSLLVNRKVREGDTSVLFYLLNFVIIFIAFISAGRVFLLEFYHTPIDPKYLYSFIPYPQYPLQGVIFHFPLIKVLSTTTVSWNTIATIWLTVLAILVILRLSWRILKPLLATNESILGVRISFNRLQLFISGFAGTLLIVSTYILRHIPTSAQIYIWSADLSKQNTAFNVVTALATFLATVYAGFQHNRETSIEAKKRGISETVIAKLNRAHLRLRFRNGILVGLFALWITRLMPSSHDLSVLAFEFIYVTFPYTFGKIIARSKSTSNQAPVSA